MAKSIIKEKSYKFALCIVKFCQQLKDEKHFEISRQLLRSGTSIGANVEEALAGQSQRDFYAKMCIASKEARETNYWLRLIKDAKICSDVNVEYLLKESLEIIKILTSIVKTGNEKRRMEN